MLKREHDNTITSVRNLDYIYSCFVHGVPLFFIVLNSMIPNVNMQKIRVIKNKAFL
jgi:hypothetical protein